MTLANVSRALCLLVVASLAASQGAAQEEPIRSDVEERVEVRIVQLNVSVIDPKGKSQASVPDLTLDHFDIRIDGRRLDQERLARVGFDPICSETLPSNMQIAPGETRSAAARPIIALVDFNYLDARGRHKVAEAIDLMAGELGGAGEAFKVYGLTRQLRMLTPGFTTEAQSIRAASEVVRQTAFTRKPIAALGGQLEGAEDASAGSSDLFGESDVPSDPGLRADSVLGGPSLRDSFALAIDEQEAASLELALGQSREAEVFAAAESDYDPGASIAAIEGIIRAHTYLPGRKVLVLFSSEAFRFVRQERMNKELVATRDLARRENFTIWTVDVEGVQRARTGSSELLTALAQDTGGDSVRRTGNLAQAFEGAREQLSCYYLLSLPIDGPSDRSVRRTLQIGIDTERYPDMWNYRVSHATSITLPTPEQRILDERIAVLLSPEDFDQPPLTATLDYPRSLDDDSLLLSRFRVPLAELTWEPTEDGRYRADILFDGIVERDSGTSKTIVCEAGTEDLGALGLVLRRKPRASRNEGLLIELPCAFERDGLYVSRGVLTDVAARKAGGGRATAVLREEGPAELSVFEPRLTTASGRDFLWRPGWESARIDRTRSARMEASGTLRSDDRIVLEYVLCGGDAAKDEVRHVLVRKNVAGSAEIFQQLPAAPAPGNSRDSGACVAISREIEEFTLPAGTYSLAILAPDAPLEDALRALEGGSAPGIRAALRFEVTE